MKILSKTKANRFHNDHFEIWDQLFLASLSSLPEFQNLLNKECTES